MAHPYKEKADDGRGMAKARYGNLVGPSSKAAMPHKVEVSTSTMQHKKQSSASGYKCGGAVAPGKASAPSPKFGGKKAGAGPSPAPAPIKKANGGGIKYPLKRGGADSGVGRLEKTRAH